MHFHCTASESSNSRRQIEEVGDPASLYSTLMQLILRLASQGLIHGDYNEFNILVYEDGRPILIDFPQMISIDHPNAKDYFERDVECIRTYFLKKFRFVAEEAPCWKDVKRVGKLDFEVQASGYGGKLGKEMEWFHREVSAVTDNNRQKQSQADNDGEDQKDQDGEDQEDESEDEDSKEDEAEREESDEEQHDHT
jgi:RIO kinase 2